MLSVYAFIVLLVTLLMVLSVIFRQRRYYVIMAVTFIGLIFLPFLLALLPRSYDGENYLDAFHYQLTYNLGTQTPLEKIADNMLNNNYSGVVVQQNIMLLDAYFSRFMCIAFIVWLITILIVSRRASMRSSFYIMLIVSSLLIGVGSVYFHYIKNRQKTLLEMYQFNTRWLYKLSKTIVPLTVNDKLLAFCLDNRPKSAIENYKFTRFFYSIAIQDELSGKSDEAMNE